MANLKTNKEIYELNEKITKKVHELSDQRRKLSEAVDTLRNIRFGEEHNEDGTINYVLPNDPIMTDTQITPERQAELFAYCQKLAKDFGIS